MTKKPLKIAIVLNIIPSYRQGFYDNILNDKNLDVTVYAQSRIPGMNLNTIHAKYPNNVKLVNFICAEREQIGWQFLPFIKLLTKYDVIVVDGNPRQVSHFLLGTLSRLLGKKIVLWTMAHSFRGYAPTENLRLKWSKIFKYIFVYTDYEVKFLREKGFEKHFILGMNNGLNQKKIDATILKWDEIKLKSWQKDRKLENSIILLSSSRLDPKNKFQLVLHALPIIIKEFPNAQWCIIGKGVEEEELKKLVKEKNLENNVRFVGEMYDENDLAPWFLSSQLFVHPAAIGLSLLHAFGYGLPVITHGNRSLQNPEYAAFEHGKTGMNYIENDSEDLANVIKTLLKEECLREKMKVNVQKIARENYNADVMTERFIEIVTKASTNS